MPKQKGQQWQSRKSGRVRAGESDSTEAERRAASEQKDQQCRSIRSGSVGGQLDIRNGAQMNLREKGAQKEQQVCAYLISEGVTIVERNFRNKQGEIDIIGYDGEYLVFFEVKYRSGTSRGNAAEAVGFAKQRKICRVADYYRMIHRCTEDTPIRFDVVAIDQGKLTWIRNAFYYMAK